MKRRIFIAINLPEDVQKKLAGYRSKWPDLPARWTKKENLHITLVFIGYITDEHLFEALKAVQKVALNYRQLGVSLKKVCYGPPKKMPPRMIWAVGEKNEELGKLQKALEDALFGKASFEKENRPYSPHITLARIKTWEWRKIEPEERPEVEEDMNLSFEVSSVEVMESRLKRGGPEYVVLESYGLGFEK